MKGWLHKQTNNANKRGKGTTEEIGRRWPYHLLVVKLFLSSNSTAVSDISVDDKLKFPYSVGHNDLSGQPNSQNGAVSPSSLTARRQNYFRHSPFTSTFFSTWTNHNKSGQ